MDCQILVDPSCSVQDTLQAKLENAGGVSDSEAVVNEAVGTPLAASGVVVSIWATYAF